MENEKIMKHLDKALEKQVPDVWDELNKKIDQLGDHSMTIREKKSLSRRILFTAAACLIAASSLTLSPVRAAIQNVYDKIFSSEHIDDSGLKSALTNGMGQEINKTYYDKEHDITVHFNSILMDDKEAKLLVTYESKKTKLKNYYLDLFEGFTSLNVVVDNEEKKLKNIGRGSRYYDEKANKVAEALSFESISTFQGNEVHLKLKDLTIHGKKGASRVETVWPLDFKLSKEAVGSRETIDVSKEFSFENETYQVKRVEFSSLETRVVVTGTDIKPHIENGVAYDVFSKLQLQFLNARKMDKEKGYTVNYNKSGVFLNSAGKMADPIFSKAEADGPRDQYVLYFAPVKDRQNCVLQVGDLKINLR
ncbi:DUF4179 domain-containing protein [Neobacillus mesonae]|uniref:DUF4179 domain-containing protein n=1 Tax=Neobacillus mesonae TaxID=1193713 RepID=A0A3T0HZM1_9BACI|nr:DUF4179 domain-containing protein [Neobacillus mesonae]AZU62595.1 hypothetical protein CHR53_15715 [Neobacillus mesonae]